VILPLYLSVLLCMSCEKVLKYNSQLSWINNVLYLVWIV
jgi:hypothetical protein